MFVLESHIQIGAYSFRSISQVTITKSVDELSDTCTIEMPTHFIIKEKGKQLYTEQAIKAGDEVTVTLGYEGVYSGVEFKGYVKRVKTGTPVVVECEDAMYLLRRKNITKAWERTTLKEVLQEVVKDTPIKLSQGIPNITLEKWIIKNANGTQVLKKLQEEFRLSIFINDKGELYAGLQQLTNIGEVAVYDLNYNIVSNDLEYRSKEERKIKVRYTYIDAKNKRKTIEVGDPEGEVRTFHTSVVSDEKKLKEMALAEIEKMKYDGFDGSITSFLIPFATRGMKARLIDKDLKNIDEDYFIKKVETSFGTSGARRKIEIGARL
ncbi:late control protein [Ornithobacterium rhinotracheale]|uniref:late control protein n=1 Tax=Ornithobacterium rhinotracheale TaxID=28251 RepID=UPI00129CD194|nr:late control protein [Ornithobacterium rhinotracheale]MRI64526.1 late control protein [Ornithobacterium rhinotracheale]MRJ11510.1 late control protein [Ornithobacterium rhinotracheale]